VGDRWHNGPVTLAELPEPKLTRAAAWRTTSRASLVVDAVVFLLGWVLLVTALADSVASWPSDQVLLSSADLQRLGGIILIPSWIWLLASCGVLYGFSQNRNSSGFRASWRRLKASKAVLRRPMVIALIGLALLVLFVIIVGFVIGADKGSLRILPPGVHQVSTLDLNNADWTTVTPHQYQVWDARFVREDAFFGYFALFMIGLSLWFQRLHRRGPEPV
jgi:hypothetical protein